MTYRYQTRGVCSRSVAFDLTDGHIHNVQFDGGCNGNTKGISALVEGMEINEVIHRLSGIRCGFKSTSCPDQLAHALQKALDEA